jgi:hypothetical protein
MSNTEKQTDLLINELMASSKRYSDPKKVTYSPLLNKVMRIMFAKGFSILLLILHCVHRVKVILCGSIMSLHVSRVSLYGPILSLDSS